MLRRTTLFFRHFNKSLFRDWKMPPSYSNRELRSLCRQIDRELIKADENVEDMANDERMRLYCTLELLRLDLVELDLSSEDQNRSEGCKAKQIVQEYLCKLDAMRPRLGLRAEKTPAHTLIHRMVLTLVMFLLCAPICFVMALTTPLHPVLSLFGIPKRFRPVNLCEMGFMQMITVLTGVKVRCYGKNESLSPTIVMFTHTSNLDAFICAACFPESLKFIGKRSLFKTPVFGWLMSLYGHIAIDRSNLQNAIQSLRLAGEKISKDCVSIAVSPEGTRSRQGTLSEFKKGCFHLAASSTQPITPMLLLGAFELWPPGQVFPNPGTVKVCTLPSIQPHKGASHVEISQMVRRSMLIGIQEHCGKSFDVPASFFMTKFWFFLVPMMLLFYAILFSLFIH